ncbi:MAG TPA: hypothetical protein VFI91_06035 [Longimicrobiaceae bacterium]|nr:hypothetical protein [Longimicrobiaceae bacterium]
MQKKLFIIAALVPLLWGCEDSTGPEGVDSVAVRFAASSEAAAVASLAAGDGSVDHVPATGAITLTGTNGTVVIQDIRLIVSEMELKRAGDECVAEEDDDDCEEFEGGPFLVNILDGTADEVVSAIIPTGAYTEFEFEVEDLEVDEDDTDESAAIEALLVEMREDYAEFPSEASALVHGTFDGQPFTVYLDAEIEVEREFAQPFRVPEDGAILVNLDPASWFMNGDEVIDLLALDGQLIEFEAEFENSIEVGHDDDENGDDDD